MMNGYKEIYNTLRAWFLNYISRMECPDEACRFHFDFKRTHSLRVVGEINALGRALRLPARDLLLASTIAVLHDVGRFEQYKNFRTYDDTASVDHGALSAHILGETDVLNGFTSQEQEIIRGAIYWHNKPVLPKDQREEVLFFAQLIRDADKLDIYRVVSKYGPFAEHPDGSPPKPLQEDVSEHIFTSLLEGRSVDYSQVRSETDAALARIFWVYDLNFKPALRLVAKRNYLEALAVPLPDTPRVTRLLTQARQYLSARVCLIEKNKEA